MKNLLTLFVFTALGFQLSAQTIEGIITDTENEPIYYATVALYNSEDSTLVKGVSSELDGYYKFENVTQGQYYIKVNMLGYQAAMISDVNFDGQSDAEFNTKLQSDAALLSAVEIKDKLPLLEQKADKLIVNVADNITNTSGSLLDVMKKVPGMLVVRDRLSLAGSGTPTILLNGKSTQYMDVQSLLRDMPGDNIKKVEIIHQPGAEYEASGSGPIINIILKKNSLFGTNGSVTIGTSKGELWDYTTGLNLSHYAGRLNVTGGVGYSKNAYIDILEITRNLTNISNSIDGTYEQFNRDAATPRTYRGNIRLDWDATDKHRIGIESKYYNNSNQRVQTNDTAVDLFGDQSQDYSLDTDNEIDRSWIYFAVNPYYIFEIDTIGQKLEFDVNFAKYDRAGTNTLRTTNTLNSDIEEQRYTQPGLSDIFATSLDYSKPLNKIFELKTGLKYSNADLDNDLVSEFRNNGGQWENDIRQSNHYLFGETIYAVYGKLSFSTGDWSGTSGLRYENSESVGESLTLNSTQSRTISKLFPSFSLSRKLGVLTTTVSYSYRIDRPRYSSLNPFVYYLDPFTYEQGNPNIRPELTHSGKFTLSYEGQPFFNVEYKRSNDAIVEVTSQERNSEEAFKTDVNFDNRTNLSASLFLPLSVIPGLDGYTGVIVSDTKFNSLYNDGMFDRAKLNTTVVLQAEFKLPGDIDAEIGGWYTNGNQEGIFKSEYLFGTSFGVSKKFLDKKAKISLGVEDFANRFWHASVDYQQDMRIVSKWQAPVVSARFSYKFGNQHLKSKGQRRGSASDIIQRASQGN